MSILRTKALDVVVGSTLLVRDIDVTFCAGEIWGVLGLNGAGKTTLLHTLAGLRMPVKGEVLLDDQPLCELSTRMRAQKLGVLFQDIEFAFPSSVLDSVLTGRYPYRKGWFSDVAEDKELARRALQSVHLQHLEHRLAHSLSGGEKRRLMLATVLAQNPSVYLLDEPTNHLDWRQQLWTLRLLQALAQEQGKIVVMVMHDIHLMRRFCARVMILGPDGETYAGPTDEWLSDQALEDIFGELPL